MSFLLGIKGILITVYTYCLLEERPCADRGVYAAASHYFYPILTFASAAFSVIIFRMRSIFVIIGFLPIKDCLLN